MAFSDVENAMIRAFYPYSDTNALARAFGGKYTIQQIQRRARLENVRKSKTAGISTIHYGRELIDELYNQKRRREGPPRPQGYQLLYLRRHERFVHEGRVVRYITKARYAWYIKTGKLPKQGEIITYRDGDPNNLAPENLYISNKKEMMLKNGLQNLPDEIRETIYLKRNITVIINKRSEK